MSRSQAAPQAAPLALYDLPVSAPEPPSPPFYEGYAKWISENPTTAGWIVGAIFLFVYVQLFARNPRSQYWWLILLASFIALNILLFSEDKKSWTSLYLVSSLMVVYFVAKFVLTAVRQSREEMDKEIDKIDEASCKSKIQGILSKNDFYNTVSRFEDIVDEAMWYVLVPLTTWTLFVLFGPTNWRVKKFNQYAQYADQPWKQDLQKALKALPQQQVQRPMQYGAAAYNRQLLNLNLPKKLY